MFLSVCSDAPTRQLQEGRSKVEVAWGNKVSHQSPATTPHDHGQTSAPFSAWNVEAVHVDVGASDDGDDDDGGVTVRAERGKMSLMRSSGLLLIEGVDAS